MARRGVGVLAVLLVAGAAGASVFGGGGGGAAAVVDVLAELVGKNVSAASYTATTTTGPAFVSTGDRVDAVKLGTAPRASIGTCNGGAICLGPNSGSDTGVYVSGFIVSRSQQVQGEMDLLGDNAYLRNNSGPVRVRDADGFSINDTATIKGIVRTSATLDFPSISNNKCVTLDASIPEAQVGDFALAEAAFETPEDVTVRVSHAVTVAGTVTIKACNHSSLMAEDPASGIYLIRLER